MSDDLLRKIRAAQIRAGEDAVIASIPQVLRDNMARANAKFKAAGGCVCGSLLIGVHNYPCAYLEEHPYD